MSFNEEINKMNTYGQLHREHREGFLKQLIVITTALFGFLVSMHKTPAADIYSRTSFLVAILLLGVAILALSFSLYAQAHLYNKIRQHHRGNAQELLQNPQKEIQFAFVKLPKIYEYAEIASYICLSLSIISLVIYAFFIA